MTTLRYALIFIFLMGSPLALIGARGGNNTYPRAGFHSHNSHNGALWRNEDLDPVTTATPAKTFPPVVMPNQPTKSVAISQAGPKVISKLRRFAKIAAITTVCVTGVAVGASLWYLWTESFRKSKKITPPVVDESVNIDQPESYVDDPSGDDLDVGVDFLDGESDGEDGSSDDEVGPVGRIEPEQKVADDSQDKFEKFKKDMSLAISGDAAAKRRVLSVNFDSMSPMFNEFQRLKRIFDQTNTSSEVHRSLPKKDRFVGQALMDIAAGYCEKLRKWKMHPRFTGEQSSEKIRFQNYLKEGEIGVQWSQACTSLAESIRAVAKASQGYQDALGATGGARRPLVGLSQARDTAMGVLKAATLTLTKKIIETHQCSR